MLLPAGYRQTIDLFSIFSFSYPLVTWKSCHIWNVRFQEKKKPYIPPVRCRSGPTSPARPSTRRSGSTGRNWGSGWTRSSTGSPRNTTRRGRTPTSITGKRKINLTDEVWWPFSFSKKGLRKNGICFGHLRVCFVPAFEIIFLRIIYCIAGKRNDKNNIKHSFLKSVCFKQFTPNLLLHSSGTMSPGRTAAWFAASASSRPTPSTNLAPAGPPSSTP